ncbi:hypothetical protein VA596_29270 [Amycolatopsis sp., V23-08]|uniref:Uncharacterized protein n=1 Tax=Amycolatopsis heterodermiae TaxID=3110235 RepID=A0ABU5RBP8_9PSEU|nr:hypothetical protein [Amycolatopsis sp., V23-08]MEA5363656.1 hypothetical protein [Amycolatopsis sp., V23-08]
MATLARITLPVVVAIAAAFTVVPAASAAPPALAACPDNNIWDRVPCAG